MICRSFWWDPIVADRFVGWLTHFFCSASMCHSQPSHVQLCKIRKNVDINFMNNSRFCPTTSKHENLWIYIDIILNIIKPLGFISQDENCYPPNPQALRIPLWSNNLTMKHTTWRNGWRRRKNSWTRSRRVGLGIEWYGSRVKLPH